MKYSLQKLCPKHSRYMGWETFHVLHLFIGMGNGDDKIMSPRMTVSVSSEQLVQVQVQLFKVDPSVAITTSCSTGVTNEQKLDGQ